MAKRKLQMLSNRVFEELAMDVYDEIDRRETDAIWNGLLSKVSYLSIVFFPTSIKFLVCILFRNLIHFP